MFMTMLYQQIISMKMKAMKQYRNKPSVKNNKAVMCTIETAKHINNCARIDVEKTKKDVECFV